MKRLAYIVISLAALATLSACGDYFRTINFPESQYDHANQ
jgi:hypothetical protein